MSNVPRRTAAALSGLVAALMTSLLLAAPASAAAYRYWSYWQGASGQWEVAQTGPGGYSLVDRDVQGWRFGISTEELTRAPDNTPDFDQLCPDLAEEEAPDGQLRVAVVIDSGFVADAPSGQTPPADTVSCLTVPRGSTGAQALAGAASVTDNNGLVCAINGYPADECSPEVPAEAASAAAEAAADEQPNPAPLAAAAPAAPSADSAATGLIVGAGALAALAAAAVLLLRRRRSDTD